MGAISQNTKQKKEQKGKKNNELELELDAY